MTYSKRRIGDLCYVKIGRTPRRDLPQFWGGSAIWVTVRELCGGVITSSKEQISDLAIREVMQKPIPAGTLLFSFKLSIGKMAIAGVPLYTNEAIAALVIRDVNLLDRDYLRFALMATSSEDSANHAVLGKVLNKAKVEGIEIPVPSLKEQRSIVDLLSRAEGIVRLRREAEKKAAELIPALFLDMFGNPATNPKGWRTCSLDTVLSETKLGLVRGAKEMDGQNPFPYVRMDAVGGGSVRVSALKRVDATEKEIGEYSLRYGDFLFNTRNSKELVGKTGMFKGGNESVYLFNNNLMRMRFDGTSLLPEYVNALFQTSYIQKQLEAIKRGTTSVFAIYYKDLRHIELRLPDLKLQQEFAERFVQIDSIKVQQSAATAKAQTAFDALLAQTFT